MSAPALIRKQDMQRAAEVAQETGCTVEIKIGEAVVTIRPRSEQIKETGIDYSRPSL
ncbi:hypothetical protein M0654_03530 [Rhizobium sp. NTR19]|uniref:Uncharacterized protein n=1 Tax=Neorhizobium turbinariae TaxID=2937795 RepID=A0ABT0IME8_9HYPH|nr:hypothetical protein [Neorhizobium turbinariae]MCK8779050.1 hypothetical protein [Neorhizobium turbinariae]